MNQPLQIANQPLTCEAPAAAPKQLVQLQAFTLAWMVVECGVALFSAQRAHSAALLAFGSDSLVELLSAAVVLLPFAPGIRWSKQKAARVAGILLFVLAGVVALTAAIALLRGVRPETSFSGIAITLAALIVMPLLAWRKRTLACEDEQPRTGRRRSSVRHLRLPRRDYAGRSGSERLLPSAVGRCRCRAPRNPYPDHGRPSCSPRRKLRLLLTFVRAKT